MCAYGGNRIERFAIREDDKGKTLVLLYQKNSNKMEDFFAATTEPYRIVVGLNDNSPADIKKHRTLIAVSKDIADENPSSENIIFEEDTGNFRDIAITATEITKDEKGKCEIDENIK
ncbi:hypothetical protein AA0312_2308 [Acetobacter tropicalis NRIC 0312]|uniref:Uncharacterized protein n=1 Tax=Acetobacter tropicalis TaxID=104102 RepID=A0A511FLJ7_9PROT|nr:hypothetical protein [Acetobacter tropicalis]GAL97577.1 hypothetical protein ATR1_068c0001 [Acetobacter tropicalis]GBR71427.1 hypothetical protein AA0312_2308 [Acetobacter tropicalis NRIC 0312]GEL50111.1 hypothetical protein ATR01nite_11860 [Acetobacter tropicalis]